MMKQCSTKPKSVPSWADLDLDLLGEIKKKLYHGDHARFSGVCKTWLAAQHEKRAADVLPCLLLLYRDSDENNKVNYDLYEPFNLTQPIISQSIYLDQFFDPSRLQFSHSILYFDGCLWFSISDIDYSCTHFLLVSILTKRAFTLPLFNHPQGAPIESNYKVFKAVSTFPGYSDCVFLLLHVANNCHWSIGVFCHGDTEWTTTEFDFLEPFGYPCDQDVVFVRGVFYFLCYDQRIASYDIASGELKVDSFSTPLNYGGIKKFFALDGELMLMYYDIKVRKYFLTNFDWSQKLWVPIKSLGDRSLFLSEHSVYVDNINYYGVSPNKIYLQEHDSCSVYSFENGQLLQSTLSGLRNWDGLHHLAAFSMWVEPPDLLSK